MRKQMPCGCAGCKSDATIILRQTVGKQQSLPMCEAHKPSWAQNGATEKGCYVIEVVK